ncbi:hypothetical protein ACGFY9_14370 [Streptomyces sp. NPDC048504]|uniref:hypothetical protein n=1 Tax=Streptomyces sp. NPDC048504 TaxID=3365559 RepID=UPI00371FD50D
MSQQQLGRGPLRAPGPPGPATPGGSPPTRFVSWLGRFGCVAAGYAVFQFLFGVLPDSIGGEAAKYLISGLSGFATVGMTWLAAALLRARTAGPVPLTAPAPLAPNAPGPLPQVFTSAYDTLVAQVAVVDDPVRGRLVGWPHSLRELDGPARPTSLATAYGLHIVLDLGVPDGRLHTGDLIDTLWRLRLQGGGWSARSQGSVARPEVTAMVLGALARAGASRERLADEVARCEAGFTRELDGTGRALTHVVTTVMRGLLRAAPDAPTLPVLRGALIDGALSDPQRQHRRCWSHRLSPLPWVGHPAQPSALHTAQAVVALDRAARVLGEGAVERSAREDGVRWLLACPATAHDTCADLANLREEVRRPHPDDSSHHEVLNVRHFTASWILRALLTPGAQEIAREDGVEDAWRERLDGAAAAVWAAQTDGIWSWSRDGSAFTTTEELRQPIWMTYQGLSALRAHAVWMYQPDPRTRPV